MIRFKGEEDNFIDAFEHKLSTEVERKKEDITLIACGPEVPEAMRAAWILKKEYDINARIVNMSTVKPLDKKVIYDAVEDTGAVLTAEEHQKGGLGNWVAAEVARKGKAVVFDMIGVNDTYGESAASWELIKWNGLAAEHIAKKAKEIVDKK